MARRYAPAGIGDLVARRGIVPTMGDESKPVIVGVGQVANKDPDRLAHPVDLIEDATRLAVADAGADVLPYVGMVLSSPLSIFSDDDGGVMVAERLGLPPGARVQATYSGAGPQRMLAQACRAIAAGEIDAALVVGGIADSSVRNARLQGREAPAPPTSVWSQGSGKGVTPPLSEATMERRRAGMPGAEGAAGVEMPVAIFALVESALAAAAGRTAEEQRAWLGELMTPFTEVAASRPDLAWFPEVRAPGEISGLRPDNRFISEPYTKLMCSFPTIDLAAAVLVTSEELADRLGVAAERRVRPWAITCTSEPGAPSTWAEMHRSVALRTAVDRTLERTAVTPDELVGFDLYSCFPAAVQVALDAFGIAPSDPRPFTQTGGLPYFGGPGASYSLHGVACTVERVRAGDGAVAAVVGVGGGCNDFSVGLYSMDESRQPPVFEEAKDITETLARRIPPLVEEPEGVASVDAMTIFHERDVGATSAPLIARLPDGSRVGAVVADPDLPAALSGTSLVGREVRLSQRDGHTVYTPV